MKLVEKILEKIVLIVIIIKIIFIFTTVGDFILKRLFKNKNIALVNNSQANKIDAEFIYWKKITEFMFIISTALLLVFIF